VSVARRSVALLGATGSIGIQTLDVLRREPEAFNLVAVAGGSRLVELAEIVKEFNVKLVGVAHNGDRAAMRALVSSDVEVVSGPSGLAQLAGRAEIVVNAVMGFAGLPVTMAALEAGGRLCLANKESLIAAAPLVQRVRFTPGATLLPIDSEHCAIHQCLANSSVGHPTVRRLILTASGGPFRGRSVSELREVTLEEALQHPTWSMGPKITVDSSTLMNKGLEVLEAAALFGVSVDRIDVVIHPQSIVHSMVEYIDGSTIAQLSQPDMRLPIAYALALPERFDHAWGGLSFREAVDLSFEPPNRDAFPALTLAYAVGRRGGAMPAWLSAANEVAVEAFLSGHIGWHQIVPIVEETLAHYVDDPLTSIEALYEHDAEARARARDLIRRAP
jgi:1-deoxy-D-xylulose-5-phosphate reductoisomerase